MLNWEDREYVNPRKKIFKNLDTGEILNLELQDDPDNISKESQTPLTAHNLNQAQQELVDDMSKTYTGTNITAPTVAGYGRINNIYGKTIEVGTGEKSPSNPYTLKCVGDDVNLFDGKLEFGSFDTSTGVKKDSTSLYRNVNKINVAGVESISFSNDGIGIGVNVIEYDSSDNFLKYTLVTTTLELQNNTSYINFYKGTSNANKIKLQKGSVATAYSPYGKGTVETISKNGDQQSSNIAIAKPLCSIGDVRDEIDYANKKIMRRCGYIVFDGSDDEGWALSGSYGNDNYACFYSAATLTTGKSDYCINDMFKYGNYSKEILNKNIMSLGNTYNNVNLTISKSIASTSDGLKAFLSSNPVTVIYELATPIIEDIDCSDKIVQYAGTTNVYSRDGAEIEVELTNNKAISGLNYNLNRIENKLVKNDWETPTFVTNYSSNSNIPLQIKKIGEMLALNGIAEASSSFPSSNTKICNIGYAPGRYILIECYISGDVWSYTSSTGSSGKVYGYINASGDLYIKNSSSLTGKYAHIIGVIPIA